jgi:hypothetical protein
LLELLEAVEAVVEEAQTIALTLTLYLVALVVVQADLDKF